MGAGAVDFVLLGVSGFPAAIEDKVELPAVREVENPGEGLGPRGVGLYKVGLGAAFFVFRSELGELGELLVDDS